ncbi:hypothetical protein B566_EDAN015749, partial [Ephemera danica]
SLGDKHFFIKLVKYSRDDACSIGFNFNVSLIFYCRNNQVTTSTMVHNFEKRQAIRETWGKEDAFAPDIISRTVFLMGLGDVSVKEEIEKHQDIVVGDFQDTYFTLTFKACMALKWAQNQCYNSKFYALTDDDIYLNVPNLLKHLRDEIDDENEYSKMFIDENADKIEQPSKLESNPTVSTE